jgi:hypothetical protein
MDKTKLLSPRTWFTSNAEPTIDPNLSVSTAVSANNQQTTILSDTPKDAEIVNGTFVPDITIDARNDAQRHAARLRTTIESFNEEKQTPLEWVVVKFFTVLAYLLPIVVAYVVGVAIGEAWSGTFNITKPWTVYSHVISVGLEMMIPVMGYAVTVSVKRAMKDRTQVIWTVILVALFLGLATGNAFAQMFLLEKHIDMSKADNTARASMLFRSFAPLIIDSIATIFLSIVTVRNLQKFLKDMQAKEQGIQSVSRSEIAVQAAFDQAAIDRENARNDQERKRMDNELLRELTRRRNQDTLGDGDPGRKGRYGGGW